jgi:hypothetical protein
MIYTFTDNSIRDETIAGNGGAVIADDVVGIVGDRFVGWYRWATTSETFEPPPISQAHPSPQEIADRIDGKVEGAP